MSTSAWTLPEAGAWDLDKAANDGVPGIYCSHSVLWTSNLANDIAWTTGSFSEMTLPPSVPVNY